MDDRRPLRRPLPPCAAAPATVVVLAVLQREEDGRYLAIRRPATSSGGGLVGFAGGKREAGETNRQAVVRETHEELGIAVEVTECLGAWPIEEWSVEVHAYLVHGDASELAPSAREVAEVIWASPTELAGDPDALRSTRLVAEVLAAR